MPIYEYQCKSCGHQLEALQGIKEDPLVECPDCGEPQLRKLISPAGFRLKGSGWYETDFKKSGKRNVAAGEAPGGGGTGGDSGGGAGNGSDAGSGSSESKAGGGAA